MALTMIRDTEAGHGVQKTQVTRPDRRLNERAKTTVVADRPLFAPGRHGEPVVRPSHRRTDVRSNAAVVALLDRGPVRRPTRIEHPRAGAGVVPVPRVRLVRPVENTAAVPSWKACLAVAALLLMGILAAVSITGNLSNSAPDYVAAGSVVVSQGESLASIATAIAPTEATSTVVRDIMELNNLDSAVITPGQRLITPEYN